MLGRIVIENVRPRTLTGRHPAKATAGMAVRVTADIFRDGHDHIAARVRWRRTGDKQWTDVRMASEPNDVWVAEIVPAHVGPHQFMVEAWTDRLDTWRHDVQAKAGAGQQIELEREEITQHFIDFFRRQFGLTDDTITPDEQQEMQRLATEKFQTRDWVYFLP